MTEIPPTYEESVRMFEQGATPPDIARERELAVCTVEKHIRYARKAGRLPPRVPRTNAFAVWTALHNKGAVPGVGFVSDVLRALPPAAANELAARLGRHDTSLADLLARIVEEYLDETDPR